MNSFHSEIRICRELMDLNPRSEQMRMFQGSGCRLGEPGPFDEDCPSDIPKESMDDLSVFMSILPWVSIKKFSYSVDADEGV
jgi:hypothetical protein